MTTNPSSKATPQPTGGFHGWRIAGYAAVALAMTAPGQTVAVSAFVDPLIADLGISRSTISTAYLIGTLTGAAALPAIGRLIDRHGVRHCMLVIAAVFGAVLVALSTVSGIVGLTAGFVGIRMAGQGALSLAATTLTAHWFRRRRGLAMGIASAVGAAGISLAPLLLERLIAHHGWRTAWLVEGLLVWTIVIPIALFGIRNRPEDIGQQVDGAAANAHPASRAQTDLTHRQALRTPYFWVLSASVATSGLLTTAIAFHQISLLTERGLTSAAAAANFLPQTVAGIAATLLVGALIDRANPRVTLLVSMVGLAAALAWATQATPGWSALGFGVAIGAASGAIRTAEAALTPRLFGIGHLGTIRGTVTAVNVGSTAFGPVMFALGHDLTGSYTSALLIGAALPLAVGAAATLAPLPAEEGHATPRRAHRSSSTAR
ncbi:MFS transporter [Micromonospora sp. LOL_024]|uniref:MFS transporter n=1 Tax=Micromonospora sp. LOL_024 TaxID=3345412 RepID=UPI003A8C3E53